MMLKLTKQEFYNIENKYRNLPAIFFSAALVFLMSYFLIGFINQEFYKSDIEEYYLFYVQVLLGEGASLFWFLLIVPLGFLYSASKCSIAFDEKGLAIASGYFISNKYFFIPWADVARLEKLSTYNIDASGRVILITFKFPSNEFSKLRLNVFSGSINTENKEKARLGINVTLERYQHKTYLKLLKLKSAKK